ncbi:restriction endonuclease subunit S [Akkermansia muciniphila]|uniref:restriction endonuclease subunit S n=1 Tax=Akkermansia muciniphila TaxID=239935 RepID=UPI000C9A697F|nr:restriction endonuclease subunit S [Akkermansia muciniphila]PNC06268.1 restriction endonuclease subunit S [Akkermansia muciniphila]
MKWKYVQLGELYSVHNGLSKQGSFFGSGYPFLSFSTVFNQWFLPEVLSDLVRSTESEQNSYSIRRGDIFITRTSETMDELGMSSVALKDYPFATYNGFTKRLRPKELTRISPKFIGYYLRSAEFRCQFLAFSSMTTRASLKNENLLSLKIPLPSLSIQKRIADILSAYDDLIENNRKQIKLLEEAVQRLYKEWFVDLRFPGYEKTKIVDGVPEGWKLCQLDNVIEFDPKIKLDKDRIKQSVPMSALSTSSMVLNEAEFGLAQSNAGSKFQNGDTLLARITPCLENGKTAYVWGIASDEGAVGSTEYIVMRSKKLNPYMVYLLARTDDFRQAAINSMSGSDGRQRVKSDKLKKLSYLLPETEIILSFGRFVQPIFDQIFIRSKQCTELSQARDRLLPKLMNGEIAV